MIKRARISVLLGVVTLAAATACGGESTGSTDSGSGGGAGDSGEMSVSIVEPADSASIQVPFTLQLDSSVPLGSEETGNHHVHLFFDGDDSQYEVIESDTVEISSDSPAVEGLEPGEHELNVSLRNADHSPAGFDTAVMVEVAEVGSGGQPPADDAPGGGGGY